jgi:hypothetical protein
MSTFPRVYVDAWCAAPDDMVSRSGYINVSCANIPDAAMSHGSVGQSGVEPVAKRSAGRP